MPSARPLIVPAKKPEPLRYYAPAGARSFEQVYTDPEAEGNNGLEGEAVGGFANRPPLDVQGEFILILPKG